MASFDLDECGECVIIRELMSAIDSKTDALPFNDKRDNGGGGCVGNARRGKPNRSMSDGISSAIGVDSVRRWCQRISIFFFRFSFLRFHFGTIINNNNNGDKSFSISFAAFSENEFMLPHWSPTTNT